MIRNLLRTPPSHENDPKRARGIPAPPGEQPLACQKLLADTEAERP